MTSRFHQIGFSQRIRLDWLEFAAQQVLAGIPATQVRGNLHALLTGKLSVGGNAVRGNREKAITILMKTWVVPEQALLALKEQGLALLSDSPSSVHLGLHWGMTTAAYPFWRVVAANVGRLLRLQGSASALQVQQRIREQYGERETVFRAARRILRCFHDWGVLKDTSVKGTYTQTSQLVIQDPRMIAWMIESLLNADESGTEALDALLAAPSLFPFRIERLSAERIAALSARIEVLRHGLDESLLMLSKTPLANGAVSKCRCRNHR